MQAVINRGLAAQLFDMDKHISWTEGMVLNQVTIRRTDEGWQVIIKASSRRQDLASYISTDTYQESIALAGEMAENGALTWNKDKWAPKVRDRPFPDLRR